ncbi:MAG TPA: hypothetical protein EYP82_04010, partial [Hydrogenothermaceae bacterium]|nr:hypothetical protein [Hydrogenothermaceae bacterium]
MYLHISIKEKNGTSIDWVKVYKYSENVRVDQVKTYYIPTLIEDNYPIKVDISSLRDKSFVLSLEDTSQKINYCFYHPDTLECNKKPSDYIYTKLPLSIEPAQKKELIFIKAKGNNNQLVTGEDIFTLYDDFSSNENWEHDNSDVTEGKLIIKQAGKAAYQGTLDDGFYYIELKVDKIDNNTLAVSCGGKFISFIEKEGIYKLYNHCEGEFVLKGTNLNDENSEILIDTVIIRKGHRGDLEFTASSFSKNIKYPISPVVEINGISHEIWSKIYNPN